MCLVQQTDRYADEKSIPLAELVGANDLAETGQKLGPRWAYWMTVCEEI